LDEIIPLSFSFLCHSVLLLQLLPFSLLSKKRQRKQRKENEKGDPPLDRLAYSFWFFSCLFSLSFLYLTASTPLFLSFGVVIYAIGQCILSFGHMLTPFRSFILYGQVLAATGYLVFFGQFVCWFSKISPSSSSPLSLLDFLSENDFLIGLLGSVFVMYVALFLSYSSVRFVVAEMYCDMFYVPCSLLAYGVYLWIALTDQGRLSYASDLGSVYLGLIAMTFGGINLAWPTLLPPQYFKLGSRVADSFLYVPLFAISAQTLDSIASIECSSS